MKSSLAAIIAGVFAWLMMRYAPLNDSQGFVVDLGSDTMAVSAETATGLGTFVIVFLAVRLFLAGTVETRNNEVGGGWYHFGGGDGANDHGGDAGGGGDGGGGD